MTIGALRTTRPGATRPGLYSGIHDARGCDVFPGYFLPPLPKAASTSSSLMRAEGLPGWPRFCSSVPSPIMPGCLSVVLLSLCGGLESGLLLMIQSPGADARDLTIPRSFGSVLGVLARAVLKESCKLTACCIPRIGAARARRETAL